MVSGIANRLSARIAPHGPVDLVRQIALFALAYYLYRLTRGAVDGRATLAFENARTVIGVERSLHVFIEPAVQQWASGWSFVTGAASWVYLNAQTSVTLGGLAFLYLFRNASFYFVRNMFGVAFVVAIIGYVLVPTAPPRFLPEWGFEDTISLYTGIPQDNVAVNALFNPYAAIPSMHVAFALMIGWPLAKLVRFPPLKVFWAIYPFIVTFVIVVTANHFLADAFLGACTAGIGALAARGMARWRPDAWRFMPQQRARVTA